MHSSDTVQNWIQYSAMSHMLRSYFKMALNTISDIIVKTFGLLHEAEEVLPIWQEVYSQEASPYFLSCMQIAYKPAFL